MMKAPVPNKKVYQSGVESGRALTVEARKIDHAKPSGSDKQ
jgi:hypothetical protein